MAEEEGVFSSLISGLTGSLSGLGNSLSGAGSFFSDIPENLKANTVFGPPQALVRQREHDQFNKAEDIRKDDRTRQRELEERDARSWLLGKANEIRVQNEGSPITPDRFLSQMMQDKTVREKLMKIESGNHTKVLNEITQAFQPPKPEYMTAAPGADVLQKATDPTADPRVVHSVPQTAAQQGIRAGQAQRPQTFSRSVYGPAGDVIGSERYVVRQTPDGRVVARKLEQDERGSLVETGPDLAEIPPGAQPDAQPSTTAQPGQPQPQPGAPQPGQPRPLPPGSVRPAPQSGARAAIPGEIDPATGQPRGDPTLAALGGKRSNLVDAFGVKGQATRVIGNVGGQFDADAAALKHQAAHDQLQIIRNAVMNMGNASPRLKMEGAARLAMVPPEVPLMTSPAAGAQKMLGLISNLEAAQARAERTLQEGPTVHAKAVLGAASKELAAVKGVLDVLGPRQEWEEKFVSLKKGEGGTTTEELKNAFPSRASIKRASDEGVETVKEGARAATGQPPPMPKIDPNEFAADLQKIERLDDLLALEKTFPQMPRELQDRYLAELSRRKELMRQQERALPRKGRPDTRLDPAAVGAP